MFLNKKNKLSIWNIIRLLFLLIFILASFYVIPHVTVDNSLARWVPSNSLKVEEYKDFLNQFGDDAVLIIAFRNSSDKQKNETRLMMNELKEKIIKLPGVLKIYDWPIPFIKLKKRPGINYSTMAVFFSTLSHFNPTNPKLLSEIKQLIDSFPLKAHIAGTGVLANAINEESSRSTLLFSIIGFVILVCLLLFVVQNPLHILFIIGISIGGVICLLFCAVLFSIPLSIISAILPVLVLFYGTSNALHLLFHNGDIKTILLPCFLTSLTTCCGFSVFLFDPIPLFKDFAMLAIAGIVGGFIWTLVFFYQSNYTFTPRIYWSNMIKKIRLRTSILIPVISLIILLVMIPGILKLKTEIYHPGVLSPKNKSVIDHHIIEDHISPYLPLEYTIELPKVNKSQVIEWMDAVLELEQVGGVLSYLHFPPIINVSEYGYLSKAEPQGRITFLVPILTSREGIQLVETIEKLSARYFNNYRPEVNGYVTLYGLIAQKIDLSFIRSLLLVLTLIFIIFFIYLRNVKIFLISILPNLFPIFICLGLMGWLGINLDMVTVPIGCLLLSIIVDDTIHFLFWFKKTSDVQAAFKEAAPGILLTSIILGCGFAVYFISPAPPLQYFGFLSVTALFTALFGDLIILPYMLKIFKRKGDKK